MGINNGSNDTYTKPAVESIADLAKAASGATILKIETAGLGEGLPASVPILFDHRANGFGLRALKEEIERFRIKPERRAGRARARCREDRLHPAVQGGIRHAHGHGSAVARPAGQCRGDGQAERHAVIRRGRARIQRDPSRQARREADRPRPVHGVRCRLPRRRTDPLAGAPALSGLRRQGDVVLPALPLEVLAARPGAAGSEGGRRRDRGQSLRRLAGGLTLTTLAQYDKARAALADATRIDQVLPILDEVEHVKLYARQIRDRELLAEASEFQMRAERRLGIVITAAKAAGHFIEGRRKKTENNGTDPEPFQAATLEEAGVDKKLSARAQKQSSIADQAFENAVRAHRLRIASGRANFIDAHPVNGARSIMGSRVEPDDSLDYFPTPPWATRALVRHVLPTLGLTERIRSAWEPACGEGHIAEALAEDCDVLIASDIYDYGYGQVFDFLESNLPAKPTVDWIVTNPPFGKKTEAFTLRALELASVGVAMFVRMQWLESAGRYERIFSKTPPTIIAFFAERVPLCKGEWKPDGDTATAYVWLVWLKDRVPQAPFWIPPGCRNELEHPADATRFTSHPVMTERREVRFVGGDLVDVTTGEIIETQGDPILSEPVATFPDVAAGSPELTVPVASPRATQSVNAETDG